MIIEISQTFLNELSAYLFIGISIFLFILGIDVVVRYKDYSIGILYSISGIILLLFGLYILGIVEVKIT